MINGLTDFKLGCIHFDNFCLIILNSKNCLYEWQIEPPRSLNKYTIINYWFNCNSHVFTKFILTFCCVRKHHWALPILRCRIYDKLHNEFIFFKGFRNTALIFCMQHVWNIDSLSFQSKNISVDIYENIHCTFIHNLMKAKLKW